MPAAQASVSSPSPPRPAGAGGLVPGGLVADGVQGRAMGTWDRRDGTWDRRALLWRPITLGAGIALAVAHQASRSKTWKGRDPALTRGITRRKTACSRRRGGA